MKGRVTQIRETVGQLIPKDGGAGLEFSPSDVSGGIAFKNLIGTRVTYEESHLPHPKDSEKLGEKVAVNVVAY